MMRCTSSRHGPPRLLRRNADLAQDARVDSRQHYPKQRTAEDIAGIMRAQIDSRKGHQRCQPEEAARTAGIFSCQQKRASKCRCAVARWKGIAARFATHDNCLDQGDKGSAAAERLFDRMLNGRRGQQKGRRHGSRRFPAALTIHEHCEQQEQQPSGATRHHPA